MKKSILSKLCLMAVAICLFSFGGSRPKPPAATGLRTIIIDAGHGGSANGARGAFSNEKDICLDIAMKLGKKLEQAFPDMKVLYTRTEDVYTDNRWRADFANKNGGDLFLSIHVNAMPDHKSSRVVGYRNRTYYVGKGASRKKKNKKVPIYKTTYTPNERFGTETYIWAADRADEKGDFVGEQVYDDSTEFVPDIDDPEFKARSLLWTKKYFDKSLVLATFVEEEFANAGRQSTGVKQRTWEGIWVLQATAMPSILVETGFITNKKEEDYLNSAEGQDQVSENIFAAVKRYKASLENKQSPSGKQP